MASPSPSPPPGHRQLARPVFSVGLVAIVYGLGLLHARLLAPLPVNLLRAEVSLWWAVLAVALIVIGYAVGLPELATSRWSALVRGFGATVAAFVVISAFQALLARPLLPRSSSALVGMIVPVWSVIAWNLAHDASARAATRDRVAVVAERAEDVAALRADLAAGPEAPATVVGCVGVDEADGSSTGRRPLVDLVDRTGATIVVLDTAAQARTAVVEQAADLHRRGVRVRTLSLFYEEWIGKLPHAELARVSLLFDVGELHRTRYLRFKRVVDLVFAAVGLVILVPLCAMVAAANPWFNPGPLLFRQPRVGRNGELFTIIKLRTMSEVDPVAGERGRWTEPGDVRITPLGRLLRVTHLDEIPQVVNVVRGDLSLIGPRPEQPRHVERLADKIAFYELRHIVRPGITGWAQVKQGYAADDADALDKLQYDFYYLRRQSVTLDARILWRTVRGVVGADGR